MRKTKSQKQSENLGKRARGQAGSGLGGMLVTTKEFNTQADVDRHDITMAKKATREKITALQKGQIKFHVKNTAFSSKTIKKDFLSAIWKIQKDVQEGLAEMLNKLETVEPELLDWCMEPHHEHNEALAYVETMLTVLLARSNVSKTLNLGLFWEDLATAFLEKYDVTIWSHKTEFAQWFTKESRQKIRTAVYEKQDRKKSQKEVREKKAAKSCQAVKVLEKAQIIETDSDESDVMPQQSTSKVGPRRSHISIID